MTALFVLPSIPCALRRTIVYVDGLNLYYGAVRGTPYKWLNLEHLFRLLLPSDDIRKIRYFTARVTGPTRPNQELYLRALGTLPLVDTIFGRFKNKRILCRVQGCHHPGEKFFEAPEEKRTDVDIAVHMVDDAYQDQCDHMVLVSGDSDLVPAVQKVRSRFPNKRITVYVPTRGPHVRQSHELRKAANAQRNLPVQLLPHAQFPQTLSDRSGNLLTKPSSW